MLAHNTTLRYDPARAIMMEVVRPMFYNAQRIEAGAKFSARADEVGFLEASKRCRIADDADRPLVYKMYAAG